MQGHGKLKSPGRRTPGLGEGACARGHGWRLGWAPPHSTASTELSCSCGRRGPRPLKEAESQDSNPGRTDTQQGNCRVESDEVFDRRLQRRQRDQKRPGLSAQTRALCQAPGAAWEPGFFCPVTDSSQTPGEVRTAPPAWKGCGHRRLTPCAPDATLSVSYESSLLMTPPRPEPPSHSPEGQTKRRGSANGSRFATHRGRSQLTPRSGCRQRPLPKIHFF